MNNRVFLKTVLTCCGSFLFIAKPAAAHGHTLLAKACIKNHVVAVYSGETEGASWINATGNSTSSSYSSNCSSSSTSPSPPPAHIPGVLALQVTEGVTQEQLEQLPLNATWGVQSIERTYKTELSRNPQLASELGLDRRYRFHVDAATDMFAMAAVYRRAAIIEATSPLVIGAAERIDGGGDDGSLCGAGEDPDELSCSALADGGAPLVCPNDPEFINQSNLYNFGQLEGTPGADIDASRAWYLHNGTEEDAEEVTIAILDTGIDTDHVDFGHRVLPGRNTRNGVDPYDYDDNYGHGTQVAGIAAAQGGNGIGIAGVHWGAKILPIKVCNDNGFCDPQSVARGILWAIGDPVDDTGETNPHPADVINISLQLYDLSPKMIAELESVIIYAKSFGVIVVGSAGNDRNRNVAYPAALDSVIAVSATNRWDEFWFGNTSSSNWGPEVELSAPGEEIITTKAGNQYDCNFLGTSAAAAHASGIAALVKSYRPCLENEQIREFLHTQADDLGDPGRDELFGYGRVNAYRTLQVVESSCVP